MSTPSWRTTIGPVLATAIFVFAALGVWLYTPAFWPEATITQPSDIIAEDYTSEGYPVVYAGETLKFMIAFCNPGLNIEEAMWFDSHESFDPSVPSPTEEPTGAWHLADREFYFNEPLCLEDPIPTDVRTAGNSAVPSGYYSFRGMNVYHPNPFLTRTNVTVSEIFYFANRGEELP